MTTRYEEPISSITRIRWIDEYALPVMYTEEEPYKETNWRKRIENGKRIRKN